MPSSHRSPNGSGRLRGHFRLGPPSLPGSIAFVAESGVTAIVTTERRTRDAVRVVRIVARGRELTDEDVIEVRLAFFAPGAEVDVCREERWPAAVRLSAILPN